MPGRSVSRLRALVLVSASLALLASACSEDRGRAQSPTAPSSMPSARISGFLVSPSGRGGAPEPVADATVTLLPAGRVARTDVSGTFVFDGVSAGTLTLQFQATGLHASVPLSVSAGESARVRVTALRDTATVSPRGHDNGEVEGIVQSVNAPQGSLVVADPRLGMVTLKTDSHTIVRRGGTSLTLADIAFGARIHALTVKQMDGSLLATEIQVQDIRMERGVEGTIGSIDAGKHSFVVQPGGVKVTTDASTLIRKGRLTITFGDLAGGDRVEVEGAAQADGSILARRIEVENENEREHTPSASPTPGGPTATPGAPMTTPTRRPREAEVRGTVQSVNAGAGTFVLVTSSGNLTVATNTSTRFEGRDEGALTLAGLKMGDRLEVKGVFQMDGSILAEEVKAED